jgi:hypothetical protein
VKRSGRRHRVKVSADGNGVVSHAGCALLRELATETGLAGAVTGALLDTYRGFPVHMPGQVFADLAVAIADGVDAVTGIEVLRDREALFGPVASMPTAWRLLDRIDAAHLGRVRAARAVARRRAWEAGAAPEPGGELRIDFDATISIAHKEGAEPNFKGFGLLTELRELSSQFRQWLLPGTVTVPDHDRTRRSSSGYGKPRRTAGWFPSGHGRSVGSVSAGRSAG